MKKVKAEEAANRHIKGYNCSQAVACAFCEDVGIDEETMFRLMEGYGSGMGSLGETCGAITGAVSILGMLHSTANLDKPNSKGITYQYSKEVVNRFKEKNQATKCKDLKGIETGTPLRSCRDCVKDAASILEDIINEEK